MLTILRLPWRTASTFFVFSPLQKDDIDGALAALAVYELGKPLVIEEIFPLSCSMDEAGAFIEDHFHIMKVPPAPEAGSCPNP